jgi:hypothetical protein
MKKLYMATTSEYHTPLLHPPNEVVQQQECLQMNCIHMHLHHTSSDKLLQLVMLSIEMDT